MVEKIRKNNKEYYICNECKLLYKDKGWAEKCESWCKKNNSRNVEITRHSIKKTLNDLQKI